MRKIMKLKLIFLILVSILLTGCWETEKGEKVGTLVKVTRAGAIIKTYEAELIRGGMNDGNGAFGKSFHFTIEDKKLLETAISAMDQQKEVKITYHREAFTFLRSKSDDYFLDKIEIK